MIFFFFFVTMLTSGKENPYIVLWSKGRVLVNPRLYICLLIFGADTSDFGTRLLSDKRLDNIYIVHACVLVVTLFTEANVIQI